MESQSPAIIEGQSTTLKFVHGIEQAFELGDQLFVSDKQELLLPYL